MLMTWAGPHAGGWFLFFPLLWIAIVALVFWGFRGWGWRRSWHHETGESILGERYAKGEITADEYRERLAVLRRKG